MVNVAIILLPWHGVWPTTIKDSVMFGISDDLTAVPINRVSKTFSNGQMARI